MAADGKGVDQNVKFSMNPFDEIAVEEAVRLREKHKDDVTKIVSPPPTPPRACLASKLTLTSFARVDCGIRWTAQDG